MKVKSLTVKAKKLTASSFSKFGKVADVHTVPPLVETEHLKFWTTIATYTVDGETEIALCHVKKVLISLGYWKGMLKHPRFSCQSKATSYCLWLLLETFKIQQKPLKLPMWKPSLFVQIKQW